MENQRTWAKTSRSIHGGENGVIGGGQMILLYTSSMLYVHMFLFNEFDCYIYPKDRVQQRFEEQPVADYFPELQNLASKYDC